MAQAARDLTDHIDGLLLGKHHLILEREALSTAQFKRILKDAEVKVVRTAYRAPDMNAFAERWVRSIKSECLSKIIPFGSRSLERAVSEYTAHCNAERPHQGIGNELIELATDSDTGEALARERLGGLLKHYHRSNANRRCSRFSNVP